MIAAVGLTVSAVLLGPGALWADSHRFEYNGFSAVSSIVHDQIFFSNYSGVNRGSASVYGRKFMKSSGIAVFALSC